MDRPVKNFQHLSGCKYLLRNQNGFKQALLYGLLSLDDPVDNRDYVYEEFNHKVKPQLENNHPEIYPCIMIIHPTYYFEAGRVSLDFIYRSDLEDLSDPNIDYYDIWSEGCYYTGCEGYPVTAHLVARNVKGTSFIDAVQRWYNSNPSNRSMYGDLDIRDGVPCLWACRLFDNEVDARKSYG